MDPMTIAALASAAGSFGSSLFGGEDPDDTYRLARKRGQKSIDQFQRPLDAQHFGQMEAFLRQAMGAQTGAYDSALANLSQVSRGARREAIGQSNQQLSQGLQGLSASGLGSSTLAGNYRSGAASGLSQNLAGIDRSMADLRSNLMIGRGQAQGQGYASLADLFGQRQQRDAQLEGQRFDLLTGAGANPGGGGMQPLDLSGIAKFASLFGGGQQGAGMMGRMPPQGMNLNTFPQR